MDRVKMQNVLSLTWPAMEPKTFNIGGRHANTFKGLHISYRNAVWKVYTSVTRVNGGREQNRRKL